MPQTRSIIEIKRDPKDGGQGEHGPIEEVSIIARKDGDGFIICAGEHNCVRIRSCESSHLARAIRLLNVHNVLYVLSAVKCVELYREVVELLGVEFWIYKSMQEQGRSRYVKYVFPFVDCAIKYYVRMRRPVRMSDIIRCMREGIRISSVLRVLGRFIVLRILLRSIVGLFWSSALC